MALEEEIVTWSLYRHYLGSTARESLDSMFNRARTYCSASSNAVRPVKFQGMFMALAFDHEKRTELFAAELEKLRLELQERS